MAINDISAEELRKLIKESKDKIEIVDVREPEEYQIIRIKGSKLIPLSEISSRLNEINWNREVIFICRTGSRSRMISEALANSGKDITNLEYGIYECFLDGKGEDLEILDKDLLEKYFD